MNAIARNMFSCILLCVIAVGCTNSSTSQDRIDEILSRHSAILPQQRMGKEWWEERHADVLNQIERSDPDLILVGDSITHGWDDKMDIWNAHFGDYTMFNLGFSGDRTQHVLWRLENGEIAGISPDLAIIMIGTNNANAELNTGQEIGEGIVAICGNLRAQLPEMELLVLEIFPRGAGPSEQREKNAEASRIAKRYAQSDSHIHFLDINLAFLDSGGGLSETIMPDLLHPNKVGYEIWASEMEEEVHRLMER